MCVGSLLCLNLNNVVKKNLIAKFKSNKKKML